MYIFIKVKHSQPTQKVHTSNKIHIKQSNMLTNNLPKILLYPNLFLWQYSKLKSDLLCLNINKSSKQYFIKQFKKDNLQVDFQNTKLSLYIIVKYQLICISHNESLDSIWKDATLWALLKSKVVF